MKIAFYWRSLENCHVQAITICSGPTQTAIAISLNDNVASN
jgi:hypothetical protein